MIRILATAFAALMGLAFGSFLNVCLSRWPAGESIVSPRSHCRNCTHTLTWWENIPLVSWLFLRGRCRNCRTAISWRYPLVELSVGTLWAIDCWRQFGQFQRSLSEPALRSSVIAAEIEILFGMALLSYLLLGLAALDAEQFWLPDAVTLPGIALGMVYSISLICGTTGYITVQSPVWQIIAEWILEVFIAASLILLIRWLYKLIRHQEGLGLGDAKLMALLAAWLGLPGALLAFALGTILAALAGLYVIAVPSARTNPQSWATSKLPLGTFLCIGGIVSSLWGQPIIAAYLYWAGF
jgi:leader peptidase (prepilin peptidase) / N-methyltransferase